MKALNKWYENEKSFPCECLCKFRPNDEKYVVATIVEFSPNNGWYEFVGDNKNTYSICIPISELEALQEELLERISESNMYCKEAMKLEKQLEALQQPKSCEGCVHNNKDHWESICDSCVRKLNDTDYYESKE